MTEVLKMYDLLTSLQSLCSADGQFWFVIAMTNVYIEIGAVWNGTGSVADESKE